MQQLFFLSLFLFSSLQRLWEVVVSLAAEFQAPLPPHPDPPPGPALCTHPNIPRLEKKKVGRAKGEDIHHLEGGAGVLGGGVSTGGSGQKTEKKAPELQEIFISAAGGRRRRRSESCREAGAAFFHAAVYGLRTRKHGAEGMSGPDLREPRGPCQNFCRSGRVGEAKSEEEFELS